jgi:acyl-homoserine lactone acylase PvdQ
MRAVLTALVATLLLATPAAAAVQPYGANDAGGFRNVLPPGENGFANVLDFGGFTLGGTRPAHSVDQQPLYDGLLYASPSLTDADVPRFFKDATFGVPDGHVASSISPRPGLTILRDSDFGVPHIYGDTRGDVAFGAGYAGAQDRLFLMDVLRHTGRAELSSFAGGSASNREMDRTQWQLAPYTEADLQRQVDLAGRLYGPAGDQIVADVTQYVAGINAYIAEAQRDPTKLPAEYTLLGLTLRPWKVTDVLATASLIGGIFGKGGGNEVRSALLLRSLEQRFGARRGRAAWRDLRFKDDPEAPTTVARRFPYETTDSFARRGLALPDRGSVTFTKVGPDLPKTRDNAIGGQILRSVRAHHQMSNWELIAARHSATGRPLGVLGPQVGYYVPQILMEVDLHGPGIDARGATFAGVSLYVLLGHGRNYAWSATTATSDNVDTFAEVLCQDDLHYRYKGRCVAMERLDRTNSWTPNLQDTTPAGSETLTAYRTVHGIVYARGTVRGRKVAFVSARTTYGHEADSAIGFSRLNDPGYVRSPSTFRRAVGAINFAFNWAYIDRKHIAYQLSGAYPVRAKGTSTDFPVLGTGAYDWRGFDPDLRTLKTLPISRLPHAVDPDSLVSWNNKQAPGWSSADDKFSYGPVFRSQLIDRRVRAAYRGGRKATLAQLVQAMEEPATQDLRAVALMPILRRALGTPSDPAVKAAADRLSAWAASGGHRRDLNRDGRDDESDAVTLMDAWWPRLVRAVLSDTLGSGADAALRAVLAPAEIKPGDAASPPDFGDGWYGYVSKDLRQLFTPKRVRGTWSRTYCGGGRRGACRTALQRSLKDALGVTAAQLYGTGDCASRADAACFDQNRPTVAAAIGGGPYPFQNRPTFQQTVSIP